MQSSDQLAIKLHCCFGPARVFGGRHAVVLLEAFGEVGKIVEPYFVGNLRDITASLADKGCGSLQAQGSYEFTRRLVSKGL